MRNPPMMPAGRHGRIAASRLRRCKAGAWLVLLAVVLNLVGNVLFGIPHALASTGPAWWAEICTVDGVRELDAGQPASGRGEGGSWPSGYCPACPLRPAAGDDSSDFGLAPVILAAIVLLPLSSETFVPWAMVPEDAASPSPAASPALSRAPPLVP